MKRVLYVLSLLADADVHWLTATGRRERVPKGRSIIVEGEPLEDLFILLNGDFAVTIRTASQGATQISSISGGEIVGEISLLDSRPPTSTVTASTDSEVIRISREELLAELESSPQFGSRFYRALAVLLAQRLRASTAKLGHGVQGAKSALSAEDEIDPELLEAIELGGKRFRWLVEHGR